MSYRGKKLKKQTQSLNKRNLVQEKAYTGIHNRGRGGRYRYLKRQEKKRMLKREEDRRRKAEELVRQADALMAEAGFFARWCPEEAERLIKQAELLRAKAEGVMTGKVIVKPERTGSEKTDPGKTSSEHFSSRRSYRPLYSFTMPEYKPDPQIEALADISVIRDLEMIFAAQSVQPVIAYAELKLIELLPYAVILLDLVSIITRTSHYADIAEFRRRSALFEIACINILVASCITGVSEQIGIYNVFKFISHKCTNLHFCYLKNFITFCGRTQ